MKLKGCKYIPSFNQKQAKLIGDRFSTMHVSVGKQSTIPMLNDSSAPLTLLPLISPLSPLASLLFHLTSPICPLSFRPSPFWLSPLPSSLPPLPFRLFPLTSPISPPPTNAIFTSFFTLPAPLCPAVNDVSCFWRTGTNGAGLGRKTRQTRCYSVFPTAGVVSLTSEKCKQKLYAHNWFDGPVVALWS